MPTRAHANRIRTATDFLLVAIFVLGIGVPALGLLWRGSGEDGLWENRRYASAPRVEFTLASLSRFPKRFEAYFNDHFALRRLLIRWDNVIRTVWLAASPQPGSGQSFDGRKQRSQRLSPWNPVVLGSDSWFYWFSGEMLEDYRGLRPFDTDQLNEWRCNFEVRRRALAQRRIPYLLVIAPEKHEIYPEYLPANIRRVSERTRLDEFLTFMERRSELEILDLRAPLRAARGLDPVYYRTGTHWNEYGAYVASRAIAERASRFLINSVPEESAAQARCVLDAMPRSSLQHSRDAGLPPAASASILARHRHST